MNSSVFKAHGELMELADKAFDPNNDCWKDVTIQGSDGTVYSTQYVCSRNGYIMNRTNNSILKGSIEPHGFVSVVLRYKDNTGKFVNAQIKAHVIVANLFVPNPDNKKYIIHLDKDLANNKADNLAWVTKQECMYFKFYGVTNLDDISDEIIHQICAMSEDPQNTPKQIASTVGCPEKFIRRIWNDGFRTDISSQYNISKCKYIHIDRYIGADGIKHFTSADKDKYNATNGGEILKKLYLEMKQNLSRSNEEIAEAIKVPVWLVERIRYSFRVVPNLSWRDLTGGMRPIIVNGIDTQYEINQHGIVYNKNRCRLTMGTLDSHNYNVINIIVAGKQTPLKIHRLVAEAFIPNDDPINKTSVNHIDGKPLHCHMANLEWVTPQENVRHALRTGLRKMGPRTPRSM